MTPPYRPKPIRYDLDTWLIMRTDPVIPKAVVQRVRDKDGGDRYLLFKWDLDPVKRQLMNVCASLDRAESLVRYDNATSVEPGLPPIMYTSEIARRDVTAPAAAKGPPGPNPQP
jgi:hypothetical protein